MIRVNVLYPNGESKTFDMSYYLESHIPMVKEKLGPACQAIAVDQGLSGADHGSQQRYLTMTHLSFESVEAFQASFGPNAAEIMADIPNYTNTEPLIQISKVII